MDSGRGQDLPRSDLVQAGVTILTVPEAEDGRLSLPALLTELKRRGIASLMVEGGAQVITAFLRQRLADILVLTITPHMVGGLHAVGSLGEIELARLPRLAHPVWTPLGSDLILWGNLDSRG